MCKSITHRNEYSFATKVFSFVSTECFNDLCKDGLPIFDSFAVTLLGYYLKKAKKECSISTWGEYRNYKEAYALFKSLYKLDEYNYKQIDVFLWTYGKALQKYWKDYWAERGVLSFAAPSYISLDKRKP